MVAGLKRHFLRDAGVTAQGHAGEMDGKPCALRSLTCCGNPGIVLPSVVESRPGRRYSVGTGSSGRIGSGNQKERIEVDTRLCVIESVRHVLINVRVR